MLEGDLWTWRLLLMKNKHLLSLFLLIITTCIFLWAFVSPVADLDYYVNSPRGYYTIEPPVDLWQKLRKINVAVKATAKSKPAEVLEKFPGQFSVTRARVWNDTSRVVPVIGAAVFAGNVHYVTDFIGSVREHVPYLSIVLHGIGLDEQQTELVSHQCNASTHCIARTFPYELFPFHIRNLETKAYKPIIIQDLLHEFGACIWIDITPNTFSFIQDNITSVLIRARKVGLAAWTISEPTSALTHPKTLRWMRRRQEQYYFHRMIVTSHIVLVNNRFIHDKVVRPWVVCALAEQCIQPIGSQNFGCNHNRRPLFRYSGCHGYDMSVLNVILGPIFNFDWRTYTVQERIFGRLVGNETETLNYHLATNKLFR